MNPPPTYPVSAVPTDPVTYTWKNIEVTLDLVQGNCCKKGQAVRKTILNNGRQWSNAISIINLKEKKLDF